MVKHALARLQTVALILSLLLCAGVAHCYFWRADSYAAVTVWPAWVWAAPGILLAGVSWRRSRRWLLGAVVMFWVAYLLIFAEETRSLARRRRWPSAEWEAARQRGG